MNARILELSGIHKHYQNGETVVRALDGVSLKIRRGEFVAIMGQSGSGKSTLMNIIGCLDQPTDGSYRVLGKEASRLEPDELAALRRETFGFVFQKYNLLATATAGENVEIPSVYAGLSKQKRSRRAVDLLGRLGLGDRVDHRIGAYSCRMDRIGRPVPQGFLGPQHECSGQRRCGSPAHQGTIFPSSWSAGSRT